MRPRKIYAFLALPILAYSFVVVAPILVTVYFSLMDGLGIISAPTFVGLTHYEAIMNDSNFWLSVRNSLFMAGMMLFGQVFIALIFSLLFTTNFIRLKGFYRTVMFFPAVVAPLVIGLIWQMIYNHTYGLLNALLRFVGLEHMIRLWLGDSSIVLLMVCIPMMWQFVGFYMVILSSAIAAIPPDILEAAQIDGATDFQRVKFISFPLIYDTLKLCVMICIAGTFRAFDLVMGMTNGGPGRSSTTIALYNYVAVFEMNRLNYACAISVFILLISMFLTLGSRFLMGAAKR